MILESVVTTLSPDEQLNIAPMGPEFDPNSASFELRPFEDSTTCQNLRGTSAGVLHVTDNVLLIASSAINAMEYDWKSDPATQVNGRVLHDCCRWYEFRCHEKPSSGSRKMFHCEIVSQGRRNELFGFNRAKHAILEATIAVTRINFLPAEHVQEQLKRATDITERTGGPTEHETIQLLGEYINRHLKSDDQAHANPGSEPIDSRRVKRLVRSLFNFLLRADSF